MRQLATFTLALLLGVTAAVALASCGGGEDAKLLPGNTAAEIGENLDTVQQLAAEGECVGAADAAQNVSDEVEALGGVDPKLKQALQRGAERLSEVVTTCRDEEGEETEAVAPASEATSTEEEAKLPPGQEKKEEKEREKEEKAAEKEAEKEAPAESPTTPTETTPAEPPTTTPPPSEGGGTGAPGGVSPATPAEPGGE